jgi:hypothetical protein
VACSVAREGCIAELVSARLIAVACDRARDPVVRGILARVAEEEFTHALLAWRYVHWALLHGGARLRESVARIFHEMERHVGFGARTSLRANAQAMRSHGYLPIDERRAIAATVLEEIVRPAANALFRNATNSAIAPSVLLSLSIRDEDGFVNSQAGRGGTRELEWERGVGGR